MAAHNRMFGYCSAVISCFFIGGCASPTTRISHDATPANTRTMVVVDGPRITARSLAGVDVTNALGSVYVTVDPSLNRPTVEAIPSRPGVRSAQERRALQDTIDINARTIVQDQRMVLKLSAGAADPATRVDLHIRTPSCGGAIVSTTGGVIELTGVSGELNLENGGDDRPGGDIHVRTESPITGPVRILTSDGDIALYLSPEAAGIFDLTTDGGTVSVYARGGNATGIKASASTWTGTLNKGINDFAAHTDRGNILVRIADYPWERDTPFPWTGRVGR